MADAVNPVRIRRKRRPPPGVLEDQVIMMPAASTWLHYLTDYNKGLGLVYERFVLNDFLLYLKGQYGFASVWGSCGTIWA